LAATITAVPPSPGVRSIRTLAHLGPAVAIRVPLSPPPTRTGVHAAQSTAAVQSVASRGRRPAGILVGSAPPQGGPGPPPDRPGRCVRSRSCRRTAANAKNIAAVAQCRDLRTCDLRFRRAACREAALARTRSGDGGAEVAVACRKPGPSAERHRTVSWIELTPDHKACQANASRPKNRATTAHADASSPAL
jgi:hypothetical protein